jgi:predicted nucleic acid-binding protein
MPAEPEAYLLDATAVIDVGNGHPAGRRVVHELFARTGDIYTCGVVTCEALSKGVPDELDTIRRFLDALEFVAMDPIAAQWAGDRRRERIEAGKGKPSVSDTLIAALAWRLGATVVTRNAKDFEAFPIPVLAYGEDDPDAG